MNADKSLAHRVISSASITLALSVVLVWISHTVTFETLHENIENQRRILQGRPTLMNGEPFMIQAFFNRILFPIALKSLDLALPQLTDPQKFLALRLFTFWGGLYLIHNALIRRLDANRSLLVLYAIALSFVPTFAMRWVHPTDIIDLTLCFFLFLFIAEQRFRSALLIASITAFNRESGAFAGIAYMACFAFRVPTNELISKTIALIAIPYAIAILIRLYISTDTLETYYTGQQIAINYNIEIVLAFLNRPSPIGFPFLLYSMFVIVFVPLAISNRLFLTRPIHRAA